MALVPGIADLSRQLMRLTLLSRSYASSSIGAINGVSSLGSVYCSKPNVWPSHHQQQSLALGGIRSKFTKKVNLKETRRKYKDDEDAIHCHGFTYYPRHPNHQDPPVQPTKLFAVKRIRSLYGCPWWEKELVRKLKLDDRRTVIIFKNTPRSNSRLYQIKHLVEIKPITMPYGLPDKPENAFLKENGELISYNPLKLHGENVNVENAEKELTEYNEKHIGGETLKNRLSLRWQSRFDII